MRLRIPKAWPAFVLILLTPFQVYAIPLPGEVELSPAFITCLLILPFFLLRLLGSAKSIPIPAFSFPLVLYLAWSILGMAVSGFQWPSIRGLGAHVFFLLSLFYMLSFLQTKRDVEIAVTCFILTGVASALMGYAEFLGFVFLKRIVGPPLLQITTNVSASPEFADYAGASTSGELYRGGYGYMGGLMRMHGFFFSANRLGSFLLMPMVLSIYRLLSNPKRRKLYAALIAMFFIAVILSLSRSAFLGLLACSSILAAYWSKNYYRKSLVLLFAFGLPVSLILMADGDYPTINHFNPFAHELEAADSTSTQIFVEHLLAAWEVNIRSSGVGAGIQLFDEWAYDAYLVKTWGSHSNFLIFLGESGIIGFACQLAAVAAFLLLCLRRLRLEEKNRLLPAGIIIAAGYIGVLTTGIVRTYYYNEITLIFMGLATQLFRHNPPTPSSASPSAQRCAA